MSYLHPFTVDRQATLDEQYGDAGVRSSSLPADELAFLDGVTVADEFPTQEELAAMNREFLATLAAEQAEDDREYYRAFWHKQIADLPECLLLAYLAISRDMETISAAEMDALIVAELAFRSGGAFTLAA